MPKTSTPLTTTFKTLPDAATKKGVRVSPAACIATAAVYESKASGIAGKATLR